MKIMQTIIARECRLCRLPFIFVTFMLPRNHRTSILQSLSRPISFFMCQYLLKEALSCLRFARLDSMISYEMYTVLHSVLLR